MIHDSITKLMAEIPGQLPKEELVALYEASLLTDSQPYDILEVGSWCGLSASVMALACRYSTVHCIDLFPHFSDWKQVGNSLWECRVNVDGKLYGPSLSYRLYESLLKPVYEKHPNQIDYFNESIAKAGVKDRVKAYKGTSQSVLATMPHKMFRLAFIDGGHEYESVKQDIISILPHIIHGGWMIFDDAFAGFDGIDQAINEMIVGNPDYSFAGRLTGRFFIAQKR